MERCVICGDRQHKNPDNMDTHCPELGELGMDPIYLRALSLAEEPVGKNDKVAYC